MKKSTLFTAVAVLALAAPLAVSTASAQPQGQYEGPTQRAQDRDSRDEDARRNDDNRDHRDRREAWRDARDDARWDDRQHNGYYMNGRWTYGQPSADRYGRRGFELGYRPWAVGQSLGYYNGRYQEVDYRRAQLRRPARGLRWVQDDRGDYLLINRSGRIVSVVISGNEPRDRRQSWRDARNDARWDERRHNGYYRNNMWTYGPPPEGRYGRGEIVYGYQPWQRGQRLGYYEGRYDEVDYRSNRGLRAPPRGYHWVRNDSGDYLLAAIAGGLIAAVILNNTR
jgi:Ni/Co efflux regulator RcnB